METGVVKQQPLYHGGDLAAAEAVFGRPAAGWIDLSTGINPHAYPVGDLGLEAWTRLPDGGAMNGLGRAAAKAYGVADPAMMAAAPGTQALIRLLPRMIPPTRVEVMGPTYEEHAASWVAAGHELGKAGRNGVVVAVNPNNPDGRRLEPGFLFDLAEDLGRGGGLLVVDEAFADLTPELSLTKMAGRPGLLVLRSFGKFYGLAGLRLGFAVAWPDMAERIRAALGPWPVPGPALAVAVKAFGDRGWAEATRARLASEMTRLEELLIGRGLEIIGGTGLFVLTAHDDAHELHVHLARSGILTRPFVDHPRWLRFGLPPDEKAWERLTLALR